MKDYPMQESGEPTKVAFWARGLAILYMVCVAFALWFFAKQLLNSSRGGSLDSFDDLLGGLLFIYINFLFFYVALTGRSPEKFFPISQFSWPK
jgi:hypothetical protein